MIKIDKTYTIKYIKGGCVQFADFKYSKGKFMYHSFSPLWVKSDELPSLEGLENIEDFLKVIKEWSYCNKAEIILIDGNVPNYKSGKITELYAEQFDSFFSNLCMQFFISEMLPVLKKNKWRISRSWIGIPILIRRHKKEWVNVDRDHVDSKLIDCICNRFLRKVLKSEVELNLRPEHGYISGNSFGEFYSWLDEGELIKLKVFIKPDELN